MESPAVLDFEPKVQVGGGCVGSGFLLRGRLAQHQHQDASLDLRVGS